jgi:hypothetical protein
LFGTTLWKRAYAAYRSAKGRSFAERKTTLTPFSNKL